MTHPGPTDTETQSALEQDLLVQLSRDADPPELALAIAASVDHERAALRARRLVSAAIAALVRGGMTEADAHVYLAKLRYEATHTEDQEP